jgi:outer membrane protein
MNSPLIKIVAIVFILSLAGLPSLAQQSNGTLPLTVAQAIDFALKNKAEVKNAELDVHIAKARMNELIGVGLPQVNASGEINRFIELPTQFIPAEFFDGEPGTYSAVQFGQDYSASAGVTASQLLFDGTYLIGLKATKTYGELSKKSLTQTRIETAVQVTKAYYMVKVIEERLAQLTSDLERMDKLKHDTKALWENGFIEKIDFDRVELNYNLLLSAKNQVQRLAANSYNLLKFQMGMDLKTPIELVEKIDESSFTPAPESNQEFDFRKRIEYSSLKTQHELTQLDVRRFRSLRWPSLVVFGSVSANASRNDFTIFDPSYKWYPTSIIGGSVKLPIFGGFQINEQVRQAKFRQKQVENAFSSLEQGLTLEHESARIELENSVDNLNTQRKNRELAREIARVSKIKYDQGMGSNLEVIEAETSLREAETQYYTSLLEAIMARIDLDKAKGNINH